ncbi:MAG: M1 family metallopeptidase [Chitinophaga sp.]|uniref:M1 family metallopeptidase n=1 Tax=Chitinophaga sp. TaxID=1869181 RepID=UPI001B2D70A3|nr:M1 family metallopeptidase [Chitinophaga sp.]MBO9731567.1 M1 family metallopeptidase [Chitinophaga sp.]
MRLKFSIGLIVAGLCCCQVFAQTKKEIVTTDEAFAPLDFPPGNSHRTADGKPGTGYWQNSTDYKVQVSFDTLTRNLQGTAQITYTNNSPVSLSYIWLSNIQNRFRKDSRIALLTPPQGTRFGVQEYTNGSRIHQLQVAVGTNALKNAVYDVVDTYVKVSLPTPLKPGEKVKMAVEYDFTLPYNGSDYMGILEGQYGKVYQLAGLFPRVAVYDEVKGWNVFTAGYYVEPGSLDVSITVPAGLIVQGSGVLTNPEAVLSAATLKRYQQAIKSDTVVRIISAQEAIQGLTTTAGPKTWRFQLDKADDGMWAISPAMVWDGVKANLPNGRQILAMAVYPPDSNREWDTIAKQMKSMVEAYSGLWTPYPYPTWVNIGGSITGVASAAVSTIHYKNVSFGNTIWTKTNHELGHTWFNIQVAADSKYGWMCEGLNTFINLINCDTLKGPGAFQMENAIEWLSSKKSIQPLNTMAASVSPQDMAMVMYVKPAVALMLLRNDVIGPKRFDAAFRTFMSDWSFKHPTPNDFFRAMENGTGEDLSWFWRSWFLNDWKLDQAIKGLNYVEGDPAKGVDITVENKGDMIMPVNVQIREFNGNVHTLHFPAQIWQLGKMHTFRYESASPVTAVILDPQKMIPDTDRSNNEWRGSGVKLPVMKGMDAAMVVRRYLKLIGGEARWKQLAAATLAYATPGDSRIGFNKQTTLAGQGSMNTTLNNIHLTLRDVLVTDTSVTSRHLGEDVKMSIAQKEELRLATAVVPELLFKEAGYRMVLRDSTLHINGMNAFVVNVTTPSGGSWNYYYDAASGYKIAEMCPDNPKDSPFFTQLEFAGYRAEQGVSLPHQLYSRFYQEGEEVLELKNRELKF